jgi:hypothetical protein
LPLRVWAAKEMTGAPLPRFAADPVLDFCIVEAIGERAAGARAKQQAEAAKKRKQEAWKEEGIPDG